ncbi:YdcF family protein [Leuconostocaceae bacterium ESL0958]|nr:YdcF family protein [Leuconostocaceae bacterium ESL0958]
MTFFGLNLALLILLLAVGLQVWTHHLVKVNRYRLLCGMAFNATIIAYLLALSFWVAELQISWLLTAYFYAILIVLIPLIVLVSISAFLFLWNGYLVWRKESHQLGNLLTLIIGIGLLVIPLSFHLLNTYLPDNRLLDVLQNIAQGFQLYLLFWILSFLSSYFLTKIYKPKLDRQYIIVLGSGLIDGQRVSPLLGARIQEAIKIKDAQWAQHQTKVTLIMSGGQGADEKMPEGEAMKDYALAAGVPAADVLVEGRSLNTYQNMQYSKEIVLKHGFDVKKGLFATNDYHVFRAAGYARLVGLPIDGVGAKTSHYFLPNALIREYVAILLQHKRWHFAAVLAIVLLNL